MVKRRPSRAALSTHGSHIRVSSAESLDFACFVSGVHNERKCDLLSEKSCMLSSEFPIVEINNSKANHNHYSRKSENNHLPLLRLPRTTFKSKLVNSSQHYVLVSSSSLDLPPSTHSEKDENRPMGMDLSNLSAKELAEREATVNKKVKQLKAKGLWMRDRLPKVMEPERPLTHWDFFLEEAYWLAEDFRQERMWKKEMAKRLAGEAALAVMIRAELVRRKKLELELHRQRGAAKIAQLIREWWLGIFKAPGVASLLSEHHQWQSALRQNRLALTQLTCTGANWLSSAISRSVYPPGSINPGSFLDDEEMDVDYSPPRGSASSVTSENISEEPAPFNLDDFEWGLQSGAFTMMDSYSSQQSDDDGDDDDDRDSMSSSHFSDGSTSEEDLIGLRSDAALPLLKVLETVLDNGWTPQQQNITSVGRSWGFDLDTSSAVDYESPYQSTVNALRHEATLPLRQLLPPGYHPISTTATPTGINGLDGGVSLRRRQLPRRSNRQNSGVLLNGSSTHGDSPTNDSLIDDLDDNSEYFDGDGISEASGDGFSVESMEVDGYPSDSEVSVESSLIATRNDGGAMSAPPQPSFPPLPPAELARRARGLEALRRQTPTMKLMCSRLPSFGPTCRVPFLPTPSLYSGVSWLNNTYAQRVPTCLVSYSAPCADAALCLSVHIGQLAASNGGDWGPHLIVTPRLLLPTWRARLMAVCPGLRVQCVLASSRGGTGRRLKASAAQGALHVCLTTYSALRSRPSRYEGISWHMVVLDQVQHLTDTPSESSSSGEVDKDGTLMGDSSVFSTPTKYRQSPNSPISNSSSSPILSDLVYILIRRLLPSARQRVCIYSPGMAGDICQGNAAFMKVLFSLLLLHPSTTDCDNYGALFEDAVRQTSLIKPEPSNSTTTDVVLASLEPFIYRFFDEDEEEDEEEEPELYPLGSADVSNNVPIAAAERLVRLKVLSDNLTPEQRELHDQFLMDRICVRACRSGRLSDLLTCLSKGVRICLHPWLLVGYDEAPHWLAQDREPTPSPPCPLLRFDTPSGLLAALSKQSTEKALPIPLLSTSLREKTHIRNRIVELLPSSDQLKGALASPKTSAAPVQLGKRRGGVTSMDSGGSQLPKKMMKIEGTEAVEEQSAAFITEEIYRNVLLEETKAAFETNKGSPAVSKVNEPKHLPSVPSKIATTNQNAASHLTAEAQAQLRIFESQCRHTRLEWEDNADWCSSSTMEYIQQHSRVPSLFPSGIHVFPVLPFIDSPTSSPSNAICRLVLDRFNHLPSPSSPYSMLCTRDRAVGLPAQLSGVSPHSPVFGMLEALDAVYDRLYPLLPLSRWISPQTTPHRLAQFLAASGKIQRLRDLLLEFVRTPSETEANQPSYSTTTPNTRPRVIFIMSHYAAFLDLLAVWLSVDPAFSCLTRVRVPIDHLDAGRGQYGGENTDSYSSDVDLGWIERVNDWPCGTRGPLLVLMHGRAPFISVAGLKAGPDTRFVLCDAKWRQDIDALVKSKLRCWSINGLVDVPSRVLFNNNSFSYRLPVYHLVSEWDSGESMEARLLKSSAIHLLPDSVFKTVANTSIDADATVGTRSRLSGTSAVVSPLTSSTTWRVQPNIVNELLSKLRRRAQWRVAGGEASTGVPMPSMESDGGEEEVTTQDEESDNASLFHNRELVQKPMLLRFFDLHEAPRDVQAQYSNFSEDTAIADEMQGNEDAAVQNLIEEDLNDSGLIDMATGDFDALCQQECTEVTLVPPEIRKRWEIDEETWQKNYDVVESLLGYSNPLFFVPPSKDEEEVGSTAIIADEGYADENDIPILDAFKLPVWVPSFFNDPEFYKGGLAAPYDKFIPPAGTSNATEPRAKIHLSASNLWGYSSEPMSESELPPLAPATTIPPLFDSTNISSLSRGSINAAVVNSSSYAIKRSAAATLSARSSVGAGGSVSAPPSKKRKLTGAAAMAAKRSASNKAAAAAAALSNSTASSSGRVSRLESDEKSLSGATIHDRSEVPTVSVGSSVSTTTSLTTISSNQKACLPRTFFTRDARAITGSSAAVTLQSGSSGAFGLSASSSNSYFTPAARFRRTTAGVSSFSRLSGVTGTAGGANLPGGGASGVYAALNNPHLHAKYALPTIGKSLVTASINAMSSAQRQVSGMVSFKFGSSGHVNASFSDVKPPEWTPLEEAALLMYTNKILERPASTTNSSHHSLVSSMSTIFSSGLRVPNFRLGELCLNTFIAMRAYRNSRHCLIVYGRINSVVVNSSPNDLLPHPLGDNDKMSQYLHHQHQGQHGVGRKVKNKMKSGMSSTPLLPSSSGISLHGGSSLGVIGGAGDSPGAESNVNIINKLRGYQHFLYLQSQLNSLNVTSQPPTSASSSTNISTLDSQSYNILRRCSREGSLKHPNHPPGAVGSSKHVLQFHPTPGSPISHHHLQSAGGQVSGVGGGGVQRSGSVGPVATTATMLMRNAVAAVASGSASGPTQQQQLAAMPTPLIQKNPSHIAALQECNISPENLVTPAMVIKTKEEREARQRTEAVNAASVVAAASASLTATGNAVVSTSTVTVMATPAAVASTPVIVGHPSTASTTAATRGMHHSQQQHPTIVTISGGTSSSSGTVTGAGIPRSANILPFSTATSVSYHGGGNGSPTVFRYTTPNNTGRQVATTTSTTGILRRVTGPGGTTQSVFAVNPASGATGTAHVISNTGGTAVMRRSVTLTPAGSSQSLSGSGGVSITAGGGGGSGGVTVLATASGTRPGSVIYHQHHSQGTAGTPTGITLVPTANPQGLPQIIRPRQQFRPGAPLPAQRFVRTFPTTPASTSPVVGSGSSGQMPPTTTVVHRTRDGLYASSAHHQQSPQRGSVVVPESQILLQRIPNNAQRRHGGTINSQTNSAVGRNQSQQQQPPSNSR